jgi:hypothetical protein
MRYGKNTHRPFNNDTEDIKFQVLFKLWGLCLNMFAMCRNRITIDEQVANYTDYEESTEKTK